MYSTKISLAANQSCSPMKKKMKEPLVGSLLAFFVIFVLNKREPFKNHPLPYFRAEDSLTVMEMTMVWHSLRRKKGVELFLYWQSGGTHKVKHITTLIIIIMWLSPFRETWKENERTTGTRFQSLPLLYLEYKNATTQKAFNSKHKQKRLSNIRKNSQKRKWKW